MNQSSSQKRVFRVTVRSTDYPTILVEATSEADAMRIAERIDGGYFQSHWDSDWEIERAELVDDFDVESLAPPEAYDSL